MANFFHVYIAPAKGISSSQVERKMDLAVDWYRYAPNSYLIYTTSDEKKWQARLADFAKPDGSLFICKIDPKVRQGLMTKAFWDWIKSKSQ